MITIDGRPVVLAVATPTHDGRAHVAHSECVDAMRARCERSGIRFHRLFGRGSRIDELRNDLARLALEREATHVLFLDEDIALPEPDAIDRLLAAAGETDAEIVSACCLSKPAYAGRDGRAVHEPPLASCFAMVETGRRLAIEIPSPPVLVMPPPDMILLAGAGALLVDARVFQRLPCPWFRFEGELSEDWWFAREVQRRGGRAVLHPGVTTIHYGVIGWVWEAMRP